MIHICRHCGSPLNHEVVDLGHQPPSNAYLTRNQLSSPELTYPLKVFICTHCWLMQLPAHASADELFTDDYAYFSSTSSSWCEHAEKFVEEAVQRLELGSMSHVVELASNDGYLLQYVKARGISCLGVEPTRATAESAKEKGIPTLEEFFGNLLAEKLQPADLVVANNVLAHVPDINDFMAGIATLLRTRGMASIEFPHLLALITGRQFDTIYHEHYSYLSLGFLRRLSLSVGLEVVDVQEISTHGGSLRVWLAHPGQFPISDSVQYVLDNERSAGLETLEAYSGLQECAIETKNSLISFLLDAKKKGNLVLAYGAAAKGNTLLNYAGIQPDLLPAVADQAKSKQGKFMPGSHIPILSPDELFKLHPHKLLVLPWNLIAELRDQLPAYDLVTAVPKLKEWPSQKDIPN